MAEKAGYKHFMLKEIFEQPQAITNTVSGRINPETGEVILPEINLTAADLARYRPDLSGRLRNLLACGPGRQILDRKICQVSRSRWISPRNSAIGIC